MRYLLDRAQLDAVAFTSTDLTRPALTALNVDADGVTATDGTVLITVPFNGHSEAEYPNTDLSGDRGSFLIRADDAKAVLKALPKKPSLPILGTAIAAARGKDVTLLSNDLDSVTRKESRDDMIGPYPNYKQVHPTGEPTLSVSFDASLLARFCAYATRHGSTKTHEITLEPFGPEKPCRMRRDPRIRARSGWSHYAAKERQVTGA